MRLEFDIMARGSMNLSMFRIDCVINFYIKLKNILSRDPFWLFYSDFQNEEKRLDLG